MTKYETEAVVRKMTKENGAKCQLIPIAGGTAVEIDEVKYLVGRDVPAAPPAPQPPLADAMLWRLNKSGLTETEFCLDPSLEQWALAAWQAQRKVRLVVDDATNTIHEMTLL